MDLYSFLIGFQIGSSIIFMLLYRFDNEIKWKKYSLKEKFYMMIIMFFWEIVVVIVIFELLFKKEAIK